MSNSSFDQSEEEEPGKIEPEMKTLEQSDHALPEAAPSGVGKAILAATGQLPAALHKNASLGLPPQARRAIWNGGLLEPQGLQRAAPMLVLLALVWTMPCCN